MYLCKQLSQSVPRGSHLLPGHLRCPALTGLTFTSYVAGSVAPIYLLPLAGEPLQGGVYFILPEHPGALCTQVLCEHLLF